MQPPPYTRQSDFNQYSTDYPSSPLPGNQVDAELNAVKATADVVLTNLALLQRDDGKPKNGIVTYDTLDEPMQVAFTSIQNTVLAAQSATEALGYASAAAVSASQAGTQATNANGYAMAASASAGDAHDDAVATAADRVQTGLDRVATGIDAGNTHDDTIATAADRVATGQDRVQTGLDRVATGQDRVATGDDVISTGADRVQTGLDAAAAAASAITAATFDPADFYTKTAADVLLGNKAPSTGIAQSAITNLTTDLSNKAPSTGIAQSAVTNLVSDLAAKAPSTGIAQSAVTGLVTDLSNKQAASSNLTDFAAKTAPTGAVVGTSDTQNLFGKTLLGTKETTYTITDGAAFSLNPANGGIQKVTLGASRSPVATSFVAGQSMGLKVAGTTYAITWPSVVWNGGSAPALSTTGWTHIELWKDGDALYGALVGVTA